VFHLNRVHLSLAANAKKYLDWTMLTITFKDMRKRFIMLLIQDKL